MASSDISAAASTLSSLARTLKSNDSADLWHTVRLSARSIADGLRVKDPVHDNHSLLGKSSLPTVLTNLLSLALHGAAVPDLAYTDPVNELLRVAANLSMDHNDNRGHLLEAGFPQATSSLLESYMDLVPQPPTLNPFPFTAPHLSVIRSAIGVLLNSSVGYDPVKDRLNSLETALTILKLLNVVYPPTAWAQAPSDDDETRHIWTLRATISGWGWRTITELKDVKDESLQIFGQDVLPYLTPALQTFCPPFTSKDRLPFKQSDDILSRLLNADFEFLEESCTLIESLSLDVEDVRLSLARGFNLSSEHQGVPCLNIMLDFIEYGAYSPYWKYLPESDMKKKQKALDICKAALVKSVVEVSGEERNGNVLWYDSDKDRPGGLFVSRMVNWIKSYADPQTTHDQMDRDDLVICGTLSLGNLTRKESISVALLSPPHSLGPILVSKHLLCPSSDIKMKHGVIGLLKHIAQSKPGSPAITSILAQVNTLQQIVGSHIWDEQPDPMTSIVQLSAIGLAKHLCSSSLDHTLAMFVLSSDETMTGFSQVLNLIKRTDNVAVKSEGTRVIVHIIKTLWLGDNRSTSSEITSPTVMSGNSEETIEKQQRRQAAIRTIITPDVVSVLGGLIARSRRYPVLVNEAVIALSLLSTTKEGGPLVIRAIRDPSDTEPPTPTDGFPASLASSETSSPVTTPSVGGRTLPSSHSGLDILVFVLKNVDNPVNFPVEIRVNACAFLIQLGRNTTADEMSKVKDVVKPVLEKLVAADSHVLAAPGKEDLLRKSAKKVLDAWVT
ncbi:hypothetical protein APHAL10511_001215 [Amanita phalloides]|nr:hypothetical protein APHAL10511_001215 [Amanita phalloides]